MLQPIIEIDRRTSLSPAPHAVAIDGALLYVSSRATQRIDVVDVESWKKTGEIVPPGMPWGLTYGDGELVMTCGEPPDDLRRIRRYSLQHGFADGYVACPDDSGSHLALYRGRVLLGQWYNKRLLLLDARGGIEREWSVPHGIAGIAVHGDLAYCVTTDDEDEGEYWLTRVDLGSGDAQDLATIPFHARGLAFDGTRFWTNYRAGDRTVAFTCT